MAHEISNALTIDVEDYFHVSAFSKVISKDDWNSKDLRVRENTVELLELFDTYNVQATFFVLGWVAEKDPYLIKEISSRGHEIACHGYSHDLVYTQNINIFREETYRSKTILEEIIQKPVVGYRAASYSITNQSLWAIDVLCDMGFQYDSSIFPVRHDRYGIPEAPKYPYLQAGENGNKIVEFPLSSINILGYQLPVAGGGYFRLFPYLCTKWAFNRINKKIRKPFIFYLHPWEIDTAQPKINANRLSMFRHYNNIDKCKVRLEHLLKDFKFTTAFNVLETSGMLKTVI